MVAVLKAGHSAKVDTRALYWKKKSSFYYLFIYFLFFLFMKVKIFYWLTRKKLV